MNFGSRGKHNALRSGPKFDRMFYSNSEFKN